MWMNRLRRIRTLILTITVAVMAVSLSYGLASAVPDSGGSTTVPPSPICVQLLADPSFEARSSAWNRPTTAYPARFVDTPVFDGSWALQTGIPMNGSNRFSYSSAQQKFTIPASATRVTLNFYRYLTSNENTLARAPANISQMDPRAMPLSTDAQYVLLLNRYQQVMRTLLFTYARHNPVWKAYTFDLTPYAGKTIYIHFETFNDGRGGKTAQYIDLVTVTACMPTASQIHMPMIMNRYQIPIQPVTPTPTPTDTPTPTSTPTQPTSPLPTPTPTP